KRSSWLCLETEQDGERDEHATSRGTKVATVQQASGAVATGAKEVVTFLGLFSFRHLFGLFLWHFERCGRRRRRADWIFAAGSGIDDVVAARGAGIGTRGVGLNIHTLGLDVDDSAGVHRFGQLA